MYLVLTAFVFSALAVLIALSALLTVLDRK